jgi:hypothetical protein
MNDVLPRVLRMAEQHEIVLGDGPRNGEHVTVDAGPDGGPPREVVLPDLDETVREFPISTTYFLVPTDTPSKHVPTYRSVPPR